MASLVQGNSVTVMVLAGQTLTIAADDVTTGRLSRLGDNAGEWPQGVSDISESTTTVSGPYPVTTRFLLRI